MRPITPLLLCVALSVAACSEPERTQVRDVPNPGPVATSAPTTTAVAGETTVAGNPLGDDPPLRTDSVSGSGCSPGSDTLPDGWWFGELPSGIAGSTVGFDLACLFLGDAAIAAVTEDGGSAESVNDFYIRNVNPALRDVDIDPDAAFLCTGNDAILHECAANELGVTFSSVWIRVVDGQADRILEQFFP